MDAANNVPNSHQFPAPNASTRTSSTIPSARAPVSPTTSKKRRTAASTASASTAGSRGVANLTPDQLAKKRANDREAQRAIRERTKGQIEGLERRIQELTSQQPYVELQHAVRQKELIEAENEEIKKRLSSVLGILQPLVGGQAVNGGNSLIGKSSLSHEIPIARTTDRVKTQICLRALRLSDRLPF